MENITLYAYTETWQCKLVRVRQLDDERKLSLTVSACMYLHQLGRERTRFNVLVRRSRLVYWLERDFVALELRHFMGLYALRPTPLHVPSSNHDWTCHCHSKISPIVWTGSTSLGGDLSVMLARFDLRSTNGCREFRLVVVQYYIRSFFVVAEKLASVCTSTFVDWKFSFEAPIGWFACIGCLVGSYYCELLDLWARSNDRSPHRNHM
jgi:hypothetical protein